MGHKISKEMIDPGVKEHIMSFIGDINDLESGDTNIIDAINNLLGVRVEDNENMNKLANAIGNPVAAGDKVDDVVDKLGEMLSTFKTNMMNNGITVESNDKFKALIDKIATLSDSEGKGIKYAEGTCEISTSPYVINMNLDFTPTLVICEATFSDSMGSYGLGGYSLLYNNVCISSVQPVNVKSSLYNVNNTLSISNISNTSFTLDVSGGIRNTVTVNKWYAIGVGE